MKGKILDFNQESKSGVITSHEGKRYEFALEEFKSPGLPFFGMEVDFIEENEKATKIYSLSLAQIGQKSKIIAGLLAIFLGAFGIHKFYLGCTSAGFVMLFVWIFGWILLGIPSAIIGIIAFIEGIIYFIKSDEQFLQTYIASKKCWF